MFCRGGSVPYSARIEAKGNLFGCLFVNTNPPEERFQVLLSEEELYKLFLTLCHRYYQMMKLRNA